MAPNWPLFALALLALHTHLLICSAHAERLSLPPGWSFSKDLSFPSSSSSSSSLNSYSDIAPFSLLVSIVSSASFDAGSKGFSLGFLSLFESSVSSPMQIYLCICLGTSQTRSSSRPFLVPVWTLNNTRAPLQQQGQIGFVKLEVNVNKELVLEDGDGRVVWRVSKVEAMEMQDNGNLVIYGPTNQTLWQSFDHPSDTLLQGQQLRLGMELNSNNHMYKVVMQPGGFMFYLVSANAPPLVYWVGAGNTTIGNYSEDLVAAFDLNASSPINFTASVVSPSCAQSQYSQSYALLHGKVFVIHGACGALTFEAIDTPDLVRLDADGVIRDYYLSNSTYAITSSIEDFRPCYVANVCGAYGICTVSTLYGVHERHFCRCPSEIDNKNLSSAFRFIDASNPSQGCKRTETLECKQNSSQALVEIKDVASVAMIFLFEVTWKENSIPLEDCKAACSSNCSCTGFLYHIKSSFCVPIGDNTGISNLSLMAISSDEHVAYVKIQLKSSASHGKKLLPIIVVAVILLAFILASSVVMFKRGKQKRDPELILAEQQLLGVLPMLPTRFSYQELSRFTKGFSTPLGAGGCGSVYAGMLPDGRMVAVKKLQHLSHGQKEFLAEIATIGGTSHVNIVHLYGFCLEKQHRLLVYEYMENGSLDKWLFYKGGEQQQLQVMSWETRFNVALGTARGLAFLHEECPKPILHFDVKPQNILLDEDFNAKLADFGLSKLVANGQLSVMTVVRGTPGYIAPEWVCHSIVSKKCDVYSFGMVLLELVSGRKNVEVGLKGTDEWYFPAWAAKKSREGKVDELVDKRLVKKTLGSDVKNDDERVVFEKNMLEQVKRVVGVALMCIHEMPEMRPNMMGACRLLEGTVSLPNDISPVHTEPPSLRVFWQYSSSIEPV